MSKPYSVALIALLVATGCNTCLDPGTIPLADDDSDIGPVVQDMGDLGGPQQADVAEQTDQSTCSETDDEFCARLDVACGEVTAPDLCGEMRSLRCDRCDADTAGCDQDLGACLCEPGFEADTETSCTDVDECSEDGVCPEGETCTNLPGSYECNACPPGQRKVGDECVEINECEEGLDNCPDAADCLDTPGGYDCQCPSGFTGVENEDGLECVDIDECDVGDPCDSDATCTNTPGDFDCDCNPGFVGDGMTCQPIPLVRQVRSFTVRLSEDSTSESQQLPVIFDPSHTVPFVTAQTTGNLGSVDEWGVAVELTGPTTIVLRRPDGGPAVDVHVSLVEFNPAAATVQTGTVRVDGDLSTVPLQQVDPGSAFVHFTFASDGANQPAELATAATLDPSQVQFARSDTSAAVEGTWWVVDAPDHLQVNHVSARIDPMQRCESAALTNAAPPVDSVVLWSYSTDASSDSLRQSLVGCSLDARVAVECCRGTLNGFDSVRVRAQTITFLTGGTVEHGDEMVGGQADTFTTPLTTVSSARSTLIHGASTLPGAMVPTGFPFETVDFNDVLFILQYENSGASAQGARSDAGMNIDARWQSVTWP